MSGPIIDSSGDIEINCHKSGAAEVRGSLRFFDDIEVNDRVAVVFNPLEGENPPYALKIFSPSGATMIDTTLRDLPTGGPQSPPPIEFVVSVKGLYRIEIKEQRGRQKGEAKLKVV